MAFMDFFAPSANQGNKQQPQANQGNSNQQRPANQGNNGNNGNNDNANANSMNQNPNPNGGNNNQNSQNQQEANPLDAYSKLWDNPTTEGDKAPSFSIEDKVLGEVAGKQDFMKDLNPELMKKALGGDVESLMSLMNDMGRNVYRTALGHQSMLTGKFVDAREAHNEKGLSKKVRGELTDHALGAIPNASHPAVRKQLKMLAEGFQRQHPDAAPQEIAEMAKKFMVEVTQAINPTESTAQNNKGKPADTNWDSFFDEGQ